MKAAEKNVKRKAHYDHLEQSVDADAARRFHEPTYSQRIPHYVKQVYEQLELVAGLSGFEIAGLSLRSFSFEKSLYSSGRTGFPSMDLFSSSNQ